MEKSYERLRIIWFEDEMLPKWAQLLDVAARLCPVPEATRQWFSKMTSSPGVDDARTVLHHTSTLQQALREQKDAIITELQRNRGDGQAHRIFAGWEYALETIVQQAAFKKTCSWSIEGAKSAGQADHGGGDVTLRRV